MTVQLLLLIVALALFTPCAVLFVECFSASFSKTKDSQQCENIDIAVLVPAHNEADIIAQTLALLTPQLGSNDRLVVIADNCSDSTAELARNAGATVIERVDRVRRGKGYALDCGISELRKNPPAAVVVVDADCQIKQGSLHQLAEKAVFQQRPVQAVYLIDGPAQPTLKESISLFSFKVKNLVRPLGLARLGLPCSLTGTGMALPWAAIARTSVASNSIVEDMKLGLDLAIAKTPPILCPSVTVTAPMPPGDAAAKTQRTRWEHGHLQIIKRYCPQLLFEALFQGRLELIAIALDLAVPPLALLLSLWLAATFALTLVYAIAGIWLPALICYISGLALLSSVLLAWFKFAQEDISFRALISFPAYILWKLPVYLKFIRSPQTEWIRTNRKA